LPDVDRATASGTLLVVGLKQEAAQVEDIVRILRDLQIAAERPPATAAGDGRVVIRIPSERVLEAVLALDYHGFGEVRIYR
jgi:type III secretory pathway lipoprotein EscJ